MHEHTQTKPFEFTLNLNPNNRILERLTSGETKQITGTNNCVDAEVENDYLDVETEDN
jgi:hypothetical protein